MWEVAVLVFAGCWLVTLAIALAMAAGKPWPDEWRYDRNQEPPVPPRPDLDVWDGSPLMYDPEVWEHDGEVSEV